MNIAIVDDNLSDLIDLKNMLVTELMKLGLSENTFSLFCSPEEFFKHWYAGAYNIVFLDILMGEVSGIDVAKKIRETDSAVLIVFSTTSNEFASQSYDVSASFYLHKPLERSKVSLMLQRMDRVRMARNRFIEISDGTRLLVRDIMYTERYKHTLTFHLYEKESKDIRITQAEIGRMLLPHHEFHAVGQGNIVNFDYVLSMSPKGFLMQDNKLIAVPRRSYKELKETYDRYCFERAISGGGEI